MKRIFEDILDDIDLENDDQSSVIAKLDSSTGPIDASRYDFVFYAGFCLGGSYRNDDIGDIIKWILNSKEAVYRKSCCDYFKKVEEFLNVYTDEYWTDGLLYTDDGLLLDDLTREKIKDIILQNINVVNFFYANKVYYIKFDNNFHHLLKFLYFYTNYSYGFYDNKLLSPLQVIYSCIPYKEAKEYDDINSISRAINIQSNILKYKRFFVDSFVIKREEMNLDTNALRQSIEKKLRNDAENIYRYFYQDFKILKVLDKFQTEEEKLDFIEDQLWRLKLRNIKK